MQPAAEEGLGAAIGAGGVDIADAAREGGVEHIVGVGLHGIDVVMPPQVCSVVEVDVAGPSQRGEPEPQL